MAEEKEHNGRGSEALCAAFLLLPKGGGGGFSLSPTELRLHPAGAQRASSLCFPTRPSPSLRFQYNFQLTSMSIEQVGQPDCWPITGNHSAPQLSAQGEEGGREWEGAGAQLAGWKAVWLQQRSAAVPRRDWGGRAGVDGEAYEGGPVGALTHPYRVLWVQLLCSKDRCSKPQRERTRD